ncbi:hypothetical protein N9Q76_02115 [Flavobacteriales bacterium]|nr:hypothetical protein [Flavobacteriales bacterium]
MTSLSISFITACFIEVTFIVAAVFTLPVIIITTLWTLFDKTTITIKDNLITIKERNRVIADNYKISKSKIVKIRLGKKDFTHAGDTTSRSEKPIGRWKKLAYRKKIVAIQTQRRVISLGENPNDKKGRRTV